MCDVPCQNFLTWSKDHTMVNSLSDKGRLCGLEGRGATLATTGDDAWHGRQHFKIFANVSGCCNCAMRAPRRARGIAAGGRTQRGAAGRSRVARRAAQPRTARRLRICMLSSLVPWAARRAGHGVSSTKRQVLYTEVPLIYFVVLSSRNILVDIPWEIRYKIF